MLKRILRKIFGLGLEKPKLTDPLIDYFSGKKLYGDDFTYEEIEKWYKDEEEAYSNLVNNYGWYEYAYHQLNIICGFSIVTQFKKQFDKVLLIGGFRGDEILPIIDKVRNITILEPSEKAVVAKIGNINPIYVKPTYIGKMNFPDNSFDLITCLGVLHHIPNVSYVVKEIYRVTNKEGFVLIREPIVSMGDWRKPRPYLTKRERGIPLNIFKKIINEAGFKIIKETLFGFPIVVRLFKFFDKSPFNSKVGVYSDIILSKLFYWNYTYHTENLIRKFRPTSVFFVLKKE